MKVVYRIFFRHCRVAIVDEGRFFAGVFDEFPEPVNPNPVVRQYVTVVVWIGVQMRDFRVVLENEELLNRIYLMRGVSIVVLAGKALEVCRDDFRDVVQARVKVPEPVEGVLLMPQAQLLEVCRSVTPATQRNKNVFQVSPKAKFIDERGSFCRWRAKSQLQDVAVAG
nr:hypothetical protein [Roseibium aggregatum]